MLQFEDLYGILKYVVELDLVVVCDMFGLFYMVFCLHNVYGEWQNIVDCYCNVIGIFMNCVLCDELMFVFGDGF